MCGRFALSAKTRQIEKLVPSIKRGPDFEPRYNIAPSQKVLSVLNDDNSELQYIRWGLIPFWSKTESIGNKLINARIETIRERQSFRNLVKSRRCIIFADGFYEWTKNSSKTKTPYFIRLKSQETFAFAGLWDSWKNPENQTLRTGTIITTEANELIKGIHNRMPVILPNDLIPQWLSNELFYEELIAELKEPFKADAMEMFEVSSLVNNPRNDSPLNVKEILKTSFFE
ncbi:MAG: SOS response-associated peptidase [Ignavibacteria bacterium]|jgi:putative SOS response-associated peptidase YedK|nr:SOS response-associated peptidase [Ignavibacteria bacterium]